MAKKAAPEMRRCIGSKTFGIEAHDAPVADFPEQPSRKDGLGTLCRVHWRQYTSALRKAANARKAADAPAEEPAKEPAARKPRRTAPMMAHIGQPTTPAPKPAPRAKRRTASVGTEVRPGLFKVGEGEYVRRDPETDEPATLTIEGAELA